MTSLDEEYNKFTWMIQQWLQINTWEVSIENIKSVSHTRCPSEDLVGRYILGVVDWRLRGGTEACSVSENVPSSESASRLLRLLWDCRHLESFSFKFGQARCTSFSLQGSRWLSNTEPTTIKYQMTQPIQDMQTEREGVLQYTLYILCTACSIKPREN